MSLDEKCLSHPFIKNVILDTLFIALYFCAIIAVSAGSIFTQLPPNIYIRCNIHCKEIDSLWHRCAFIPSLDQCPNARGLTYITNRQNGSNLRAERGSGRWIKR